MLRVAEWTGASAWILIVVVIICRIALAWLGRGAKARVQDVQANYVALIAEQPAVLKAYGPTSLLALTWTVNYWQSTAQYVKIAYSKPRSWLSSSILGIWLAIVWVSNDALNLLPRIGYFIFGTLISMLLSVVTIAMAQRKQFPQYAPLHHFGLIVGPDQLRRILGGKQLAHPWSTVDEIGLLMGSVHYRANGVPYLIPPHAFHQKEDARVFVSTLNALKAGLPPPPFDWSGYVPQKPTVEGVWPPPIS